MSGRPAGEKIERRVPKEAARRHASQKGGNTKMGLSAEHLLADKCYLQRHRFVTWYLALLFIPAECGTRLLGTASLASRTIRKVAQRAGIRLAHGLPPDADDPADGLDRMHQRTLRKRDAAEPLR